MAPHTPITRRDRRMALRRGSSFIELPAASTDGQPMTAPLATVSVAGLEFALQTGNEAIRVGSRIPHVTVRIGECTLRGELLVRNVRTHGERPAFGCLFYPAPGSDEERWMTVLSGIDAALPLDDAPA